MVMTDLKLPPLALFTTLTSRYSCIHMAVVSSPDFDRADISPLVLSDQDSMVDKRKEIPHIDLELEGSSSRKKKNEKGGTHTPRHHALGFISDYSRGCRQRFIRIDSNFLVL